MLAPVYRIHGSKGRGGGHFNSPSVKTHYIRMHARHQPPERPLRPYVLKVNKSEHPLYNIFLAVPVYFNTHFSILNRARPIIIINSFKQKNPHLWSSMSGHRRRAHPFSNSQRCELFNNTNWINKGNCIRRQKQSGRQSFRQFRIVRKIPILEMFAAYITMLGWTQPAGSNFPNKVSP